MSTDLISSIRTSRSWRPELVLARGPLALAQTGDGSYRALYGAVWSLALTDDGAVLAQAAGERWQPQIDADALDGLDTLAVHISLAFDQAARPVVAYEKNGGVWVRGWSASRRAYVTYGPFDGHHPLLVSDATLSYTVPDSDVVLIVVDGTAVQARVQRERYSTAYTLATVPRGTVLDQLVQHPYRMQILGMAGTDTICLSSALYPVSTTTGMAGGITLTGGQTELVLQSYASRGEAMAGSMSLMTGQMLATLQSYSDRGEAMAGGMSLTAGQMPAIQVPYAGGTESMVGAMSLLAGQMPIIGIARTEQTAMRGGITLRGGVYA